MIFGNSNSKFVSGATTVDLPYSVLDPDWIMPDVLEHQSIISGKKNFINKGYYSEFKVQVNLFKYSDRILLNEGTGLPLLNEGTGESLLNENYIDESNYTVNDKFNEIESYKFSKVTFYPHKDGDPIKDIFGNESQFLISDIEPYYLTSTTQKDIALITFTADRYSSLITVAHLGYGFGYGLGYGDQL